MNTVELIDTHTHLDGFARRGELPAVLDRARAAGVVAAVAIGTEPDDWSLNRQLAGQYPGLVHYTAGFHPCSVGADWSAGFAQLEGFWDGRSGPIPVALGECGLDRFHLPTDPAEATVAFARQREAFVAQLALARRLACPIVVHSRLAFRECVDLIVASGVDPTRVVFHCFSEGPDQIGELNRLGARGSFTGILTYKNAGAVRAAAQAQGLARCMIETDAPFLAPTPHRGKPNEPAYVRFTAESAAGLFGVPLEVLAKTTTDNARTFFGI